MSEIIKNQKYKVINKLGQGAFGSAYKVLNKDDNKYYLIKELFLNSDIGDEKKKIKDEAEILSKLNSENIVKYYDSFEENGSFNIVMEYCDGFDLRKFINEHKEKNDKIKEKMIYNIILELCYGIKEIHKNNLIHRDLKPENIFLTSNMNIKIGDFGITKKLKDVNDYAKTQVGTYLYMAPEIIKGEKYNTKVDIWALGCIIHELCTLNYCFNGSSLSALMNRILECKYEKIDSKNYGL